LGRRKAIWPVKTEWWGAGVVVCLEQGADFHMALLMPLPLTVSCFSKIQIVFTFLVLVYPGSPRKGSLNGCVFVVMALSSSAIEARNRQHEKANTHHRFDTVAYSQSDPSGGSTF